MCRGRGPGVASPSRAGRAARTLAALSLIAALPTSTSAIVCTAPGSHGSVRQALIDTDCSEIQLADQTYLESLSIARAVQIVGSASGASTVRGSIAISGPVVVGLTDVVVTGCADARVVADGGASLSGAGLVVVTSSSPLCPFLFADGFESTDTTAWSQTQP